VNNVIVYPLTPQQSRYQRLALRQELVIKTYVLFHGIIANGKAASGCYDGFASAWAARKHFGYKADVEYLPVAYGHPVPTIPAGSVVYILDFSYSREVMLELAETHKKVVCLDHHVTAQEALKGLEHPNLEVVFDMARSGALITWDYFNPDKRPPHLIAAVSDRDLWKFEILGSKEIHTYLQSYPFDFCKWDEICESLEQDVGRKAAIESGIAIVRFRDSQVKQTCDQAELCEIAGYEVPVVNATGFWSEVGHELLARYPDNKFAVSWYRAGDGQVKLSFRSRKDFDCSAVAKVFGGGGHAQAAGAAVPYANWSF